MSVDFEAIRKQEWPVLEQMVFLDAACVSFAPQRTVRAVKAFADMTATQEEENSSAHHIAMDSLRGKAYDEAAKLLNADPEEIALVESTSHGLNIAARTVRWGAKLTQAASRKTICSRTGHSCLRIASKSTDISTTSYIFVGDGWVVFLWFSFTGEATSLQSTDFLRSNAVIVKNYQLWSWENRL